MYHNEINKESNRRWAETNNKKDVADNKLSILRGLLGQGSGSGKKESVQEKHARLRRQGVL